MQQLAFSQTLTAADFLLIALVKLAAPGSCLSQRLSRRANFPGGVRQGVALGLMLHAHVDAVPAAITVSCAILGMVLVVTRDGWLSLFMAAVVVPDTTLLPLLCMVMLPGLAAAGRETVDDCQTGYRLNAAVSLLKGLRHRAQEIGDIHFRQHHFYQGEGIGGDALRHRLPQFRRLSDPPAARK